MPGEKYTKADMVERIFEKTDCSRKDIHTVVDVFLDELKKILTQDGIAEFRGFGTFEIRGRKGRERARNPKTGELFPVKAHGAVVFRPGKELKEAVRPLREE